jgi:cytochrome c556
MNKLLKLVMCALIVSSSTAALAEEPFENEIKARQSFMQVVKFNISILGDMAKGNRDYDSSTAEAAAKNIHMASLMNNSAMWPQGSDNKNAKLSVKTRALPVIWSQYPKVVEKHEKWIETAKQLAQTAGKGLDHLRNNIGPLGKSCKSCHDKFRAKD